VTTPVIGIIAALPREVFGLIARMDIIGEETTEGRSVLWGRLNRKDIVVMIGGVGMKNARAAVRNLIRRHRPELILSAGFAGGLDPALALGDAVVPSRIIDERGGRIDTPPDLLERLLSALPDAETGSALTTPRFIPDKSEKEDLFRRYGARAVDMESMAVAAEAAACGLPHLALRVISDTALQTLPPLSQFLDADGDVVPMRAVRYFIRHPRHLIPTIRFTTGLGPAAQSLTGLLVTAVTELP